MVNNMDDVFEEIFGFRPTKTGAGLELITNSVLMHLNSDAKVTHNVFMKSTFSSDKHQLDGLVEDGSSTIFVEAKDHMEDNKKVGRPEVSKLAGSLIVLKDVSSAVLSSSTGFTKPARQYVDDLELAKATPVKLMLVRPFQEGDDDGLIRSVQVNLHIETPDYRNAKFAPVFSRETMNKIARDHGIEKGGTANIPAQIDGFYREDGTLIDSVFNLSAKLRRDEVTNKSTGAWGFDEAAYIYVSGNLYLLEEFQYDVPFEILKHSFAIESDEPSIFVEYQDGSDFALITAKQLKEAYGKLSAS